MKLYSIEEIANEYGITTRKARDWIRRGSIPYQKLPKTRKYTKKFSYTDFNYFKHLGNLEAYFNEGEKDDI